MPHSSGGGSHGGGSHGGHHGGGHGGHSAPRVSRNYYHGSVRYRYRHHGRERYFYASPQYRPFHPARLLLLFIYIPIFIAVCTSMKTTLFGETPKSNDIVIIDGADVLDDVGNLNNAMSSFYHKTGVVPAVVTVNHSNWQGYYSSLEEYAFDRYLQEFDDEMHWLIVYSEPDTAYSQNWCWEGMQGDNTDSILTATVTSEFRHQFQYALECNDRSVDSCLVDSFMSASDYVRKPNRLSEAAPFLLVFVFLCFHAYFMLGLNELKYRGASRCEDDAQTIPQTVPMYQNTIPYGTQQMYGQQTYGQQPMGMQQPYAQQVSQQTMAQPQTVRCKFCMGTYPSNLPECPQCGAPTSGNL